MAVDWPSDLAHHPATCAVTVGDVTGNPAAKGQGAKVLAGLRVRMGINTGARARVQAGRQAGGVGAGAFLALCSSAPVGAGNRGTHTYRSRIAQLEGTHARLGVSALALRQPARPRRPASDAGRLPNTRNPEHGCGEWVQRARGMHRLRAGSTTHLFTRAPQYVCTAAYRPARRPPSS